MPTVRVAKKIVTEAVKPVAPKPRKPVDAAGVKDIITQTNPLWQVLLKRLQKVGRVYGFQRIETPMVEELALYQSYYKDNESVVPVSFEAGGKTMALRPTILPSVLRSYVQHKVAEEKTLSKWLYCGNVMTADSNARIISDY